MRRVKGLHRDGDVGQRWLWIGTDTVDQGIGSTVEQSNVMYDIYLQTPKVFT